MVAPLLHARGLIRRYPGVLALDGADFDIYPGEVIGLVGKNGAGKSTLIRIMAGVERPDAGVLEIGGKPAPADYDPIEAHHLGLAFMHQELGNAPAMTVMENVALGSAFPRRLGLFISWPSLRQRVTEVLRDLDPSINPDARVGDLSNVQQRIVMIARALYHHARVLVLDEPSTALTESEIVHLHGIVRSLRDGGRAIVYVSHRLREIVSITDRIVVMQDGRVTLERPTAESSEADIIAAIAGSRATAAPNPSTAASPSTATENVILRVRDLSRTGAVAQVSFDLYAGEVLGIGGLVGSGRTELVRLIFGADRSTEGSVEIDGKAVRLMSPRDAVEAGIALLPEDRRNQGLVLGFSVNQNITLASLSSHRRRGLPLVNKASENRTARGAIENLLIRTPSGEQQVRRLSGGNQQKVVLAKWLMLPNRVIIFDEPTQGIDIHAKQEIFALIRRMAAEGRAVIVISSDFTELTALCSRVMVMREGKVTGFLGGTEISESAIVRLAYGTAAA